MPNDSMASLNPAELEAHLAAGRRLLAAKRAEAHGTAEVREAQTTIASLAATASPAPSLARAPSPSASAPARPAIASRRAAWTSTQMAERVQKIIQSHWAQGRAVLAVQLCSSPCSIEEAIGALKASHADTGSTSSPDARVKTVESVAARSAAAGKRPETAEQIYSRRRNAATSAVPPANSGRLGASEIYARRRT